tara:strand:+ start:1022 stop:1414 length:393 start_codon:yes stop_codon:yes gene_type:complete
MNVLRWILVFPGTILAVFLVMFPWHWFLVLMFYLVSPPSFVEIETVERLGYGFFSPLTLIVASSYIAPSKNITVGKVFAILITLFIFWGIFFEKAYDFKFSYNLILVVLHIAGIYTGLKIIRDKFDSEGG